MWHRCLCSLPLLALLVLAVPGEAQQAKGKKYALLVGVTDYNHASLQPLKYTENDVEKMAKLLNQPGSGFANVRLLTSTRGKKHAADAPTGANIKKALAELIADKTRHDLVLIALSGHGVTLEVEDPDGKGEAKSYVYFCPSDADLVGVSYRTGTSKTLLNLNGLFGSLGRSGAGTKLVLVDACRNELKAESATRSIDPKQVTIPNGVGALFSCKAGQTAHEVKKLEHGVFFYHVLEGLKGRAKTEDGEVTWDSLGAYVRREVPRVVPGLVGGGARQTPHAMTNIEGEPPVLLKVGKAVVSGGDTDKRKPKTTGRRGEARSEEGWVAHGDGGGLYLPGLQGRRRSSALDDSGPGRLESRPTSGQTNPQVAIRERSESCRRRCTALPGIDLVLLTT